LQHLSEHADVARQCAENAHRTARNIHRVAASCSSRRGGERNSDASNESDASDALQRSGAGASGVARRGASTKGKTLGGEQQPPHENGRTWPKCTAHRALARAAAEWFLIDRCTMGGGVIRSGTWPARWCRSARHQPFWHRRTLGTLQPQSPQPLGDGATQAVARRCTGVVKLAAHVSETAARNGRAPCIHSMASPRKRHVLDDDDDVLDVTAAVRIGLFSKRAIVLN
jgi:hypothetical protein